MNSLRIKIAVAMALLAFVATALVGAVGYRSTSARLVDEIDQSIEQAIALVTEPGAGRNNAPARGLFDTYSVRFFNRQGQQVSSSFDETVEVTDAARAVIGVDRGFHVGTVALDGERFRVHTRGAARGGVQVARSLGETDRVLSDLRQRTAQLVIIVSLAAAVVGWLLASTVAAPLRRLTRAAEEVESSGNLDVEVAEERADEVGRLGAAFQSMLGALRRSRTEQQRLVQDAGHELRTPLTSLRTNLAVMRRHPDMAADMHDRILDDLDSEIGELTDLVNELVTVASGDLAGEPADLVDLGSVAQTVAERAARRYGRSIDVDAAGAGIVFAPPMALERAVTNLVQNATKFDTSAEPIKVMVSDGDLTVLDRGPGIPDADLALVFDRFHRASESRTMPGSGLGLAIVRETIERCGGTVSATNRLGGGAEVGFSLPLP